MKKPKILLCKSGIGNMRAKMGNETEKCCPNNGFFKLLRIQ